VSDRFRSAAVPVLIFSRQWAMGMRANRVKMDAPPFTDQFAVFSKDPVTAKNIVNDALQSIVYELEANHFFSRYRSPSDRTRTAQW